MLDKFETICIIGLGYIGLPTAAIFAGYKVKVIGVDVNQHVVDTVNRGEVHIVEPDLDIIVHAAAREGYLRATTRPEAADVFIIAVPTPFKVDAAGSNQPDMAYIKAAAISIAPVLKKGDTVILESTSPVGATEKMAEWLAKRRPDLSFPQTHGADSDIRVAYCPERVLPGHVLQELLLNDRIIGGITARCSDVAAQVYKIFVQGDCIKTNSRTAEMCKLAENSFRDVNIAFANELSIICDKQGIDVWEMIKLANRHPRVDILQPGPGVGGHCIAVDPWFIVSSAPDEAQLIRTAREVNDKKTVWVIEKIKERAKEINKQCNAREVGNAKIAFYGLAFKPDIDDLRGSPAVEIVKIIAESYPASVIAVEPNLNELPDDLENVKLVGLEEASLAHLKVLLVDHKEFKNISIERENCLDFKGVWDAK